MPARSEKRQETGQESRCQSKNSPLHRQGNLLRPDFYQPLHRRLWLYGSHTVRHTPGNSLGLSGRVYQAVNPIIQTFKPVSPLAWLPLVTMVVSALYVSDDPMFEKSFLTSAFTVALCCLWPTVVNTIVGVASINRDLVDVSRVLRLSWPVYIKTIVIPRRSR